MLDAAVIQELKQNNVSIDAEKTKQRTAEVWKTAAKEAQENILVLAGVARSTVQRAYKTGNISAKLVVPFAQTLNINPHYLTGEADECGACSDELLLEFLQQHKYQHLLATPEGAKQKRPRKAARRQAQTHDEQPSQQPQATVGEEEAASIGANCEYSGQLSVIDAEKQAFIENITEDEMIFLLRAIMLKAKAGGANAELATKLKLLLLS